MTIYELYQITRFLVTQGNYSEGDIWNMYPFEFSIYYYMVGVELQKKIEAMKNAEN